MGVAWSSYKEKRKEKKELKRKRKLHSSMSLKAKIIKMKAQMEQQIQAIDEQVINLENIALTASNRSQQLVKSASSPTINTLAELSEAPDLHLHSSVSESEGLMFEACQFAPAVYERASSGEMDSEITAKPNLPVKPENLTKCASFINICPWRA